MSPTKIRLAMRDGARWVRPSVVRRGLAIHRGALTYPPWHTDYWNVTHVASGRIVVGRVKTRARAETALRRLLPMTDWTRPSEAIAVDAEVRARVQAVRNEFEFEL